MLVWFFRRYAELVTISIGDRSHPSTNPPPLSYPAPPLASSPLSPRLYLGEAVGGSALAWGRCFLRSSANTRPARLTTNSPGPASRQIASVPFTSSVAEPVLNSIQCSCVVHPPALYRDAVSDKAVYLDRVRRRRKPSGYAHEKAQPGSIRGRRVIRIASIESGGIRTV